MSIQEIIALLRRHLAAVLVVIVAAAAVAMVIKRTPVLYQESGTVVFNAPGSADFPNPYTSFSGSIVVAAGVTTLFVMSPQEQLRIRSEGATGGYDAELFNSYDLEYPDYSAPYVTVTARSTDPAQAHLTFGLVANELYRELASLQAQTGVTTHNLITAHMVGDTGPLPQTGSSKRVDAGLLVLATVAAFAIAILLDRRQVRLSSLLRRAGSLAARSSDDDRRSSRLREQPAP